MNGLTIAARLAATLKRVNEQRDRSKVKLVVRVCRCMTKNGEPVANCPVCKGKGVFYA
jgi:rubrerythrin